MTLIIYSLLITLFAIILFYLSWSSQQNLEESATAEKREDLKEDKQANKRKLTTTEPNWEVAEELGGELKKLSTTNNNQPAIEPIRPSIESFSTYDYPELADYELETKFKQNRITALVRDPYWIYLYWEINSLFEINGQPSLQILDITNQRYPDQEPNHSFTVEIDLEAENWYLKLPAAKRRYTVELGINNQYGEFNLLARSNYFTSPRANPSDKYDLEWMGNDALLTAAYPTINSDSTLETISSPAPNAEYHNLSSLQNLEDW
ncbi:MAG: DUF4912 domain-containing protein [Bacillota bacterium]